MKTVKVNGWEYAIDYNMYRLRLFFESKGMSLAQGFAWSEEDPIFFIYEVFADMVNVARVKKDKEPLTVMEIADQVGDDLEAVSAIVSEFFPKADKEADKEKKQKGEVGKAK